MKLLIKQRMFSWFDSFDILDESGNAVFTVKGRPSWGHKLEIYDQMGNHVGTIKEEIFSFLPKFKMYHGSNYIGQIDKKLSLFKPVYTLDCNGWYVQGDWLSWNYEVFDPNGQIVMNLHKEVFNWTDTYMMDIAKTEDALISVMIVLAIDAANCSENGG